MAHNTRTYSQVMIVSSISLAALQAGPMIHSQAASAASMSAHGNNLQPSDLSLGAVVDVLHQACDVMGGSIKPGKSIKRDTIRCFSTNPVMQVWLSGIYYDLLASASPV